MNASDVKRNGVRVVAATDGFVAPFGQTITCRNPQCPPNARKLEKRKLSWPDACKALPARAKAPDGKEWPETDVSTTSPEYVKMLNELVPSVGCHYSRFTLLSTGGCDTSMATKLLDTTQTHAAIRRDLLTGAKERERLALTRYVLFAREDEHRSYEVDAGATATTTFMPSSPSAVRNPMFAAWMTRRPPREPEETSRTRMGADAAVQEDAVASDLAAAPPDETEPDASQPPASSPVRTNMFSSAAITIAVASSPALAASTDTVTSAAATTTFPSSTELAASTTTLASAVTGSTTARSQRAMGSGRLVWGPYRACTVKLSSQQPVTQQIMRSLNPGG